MAKGKGLRIVAIHGIEVYMQLLERFRNCNFVDIHGWMDWDSWECKWVEQSQAKKLKQCDLTSVEDMRTW